MKIVFQNDHFVAVDKPCGVLTTPSRYEDADARSVLGRQIEEHLQCQVFPVHRLDFEVSGVTLFALDAKAHAAANHVFEKHQVQKTYQALTSPIQNIPAQVKIHFVEPELNENFRWVCHLMRGKRRAYENAKGKISITHAQYFGEATAPGLPRHHRWQLRPETGRSHQLRYELFRHGFPILGDQLYAGHSLPGQSVDEIKLRSISLQFLDAKFCSQWQLPNEILVSGLF